MRLLIAMLLLTVTLACLPGFAAEDEPPTSKEQGAQVEAKRALERASEGRVRDLSERVKTQAEVINKLEVKIVYLEKDLKDLKAKVDALQKLLEQNRQQKEAKEF